MLCNARSLVGGVPPCLNTMYPRLTRGLRVAPPHGVRPDEGHHLAIAEAHAAEDIPDVLDGPADRALVRVGQAPWTTVHGSPGNVMINARTRNRAGAGAQMGHAGWFLGEMVGLIRRRCPERKAPFYL